MTRQRVADTRYTCEPFDKQDIGLLTAYNKIKKFEIKNPKDLKHGLIVNLRDLLSSGELAIYKFWLDGRPSSVKNMGNSLRFERARSIAVPGRKYRNAQALWCIGKGEGYVPRTRAERRGSHGGMFVGTLISQNRSFQYNSKVLEFAKLLEKAPNFQRHCIMAEVPYTQKSYEEYKFKLSYLEMVDTPLYTTTTNTYQ